MLSEDLLQVLMSLHRICVFVRMLFLFGSIVTASHKKNLTRKIISGAKYSACMNFFLIYFVIFNGFLNCLRATLTNAEIEPLCETKSETSSLIDLGCDIVIDQINDALSGRHIASTQLV